MPGCKRIQVGAGHLLLAERSQKSSLQFVDHYLFRHVPQEIGLALISQIRELEHPIRGDPPSRTLEDLHSLRVGRAEYKVIACLVILIEHPERSAAPTDIGESLLILC